MWKYVVWTIIVLIAIIALLGALSPMSNGDDVPEFTLIDYVKAGSWPGHFIILLSCIALASGFVDLLETRLSRVISSDVTNQLETLISNKQYDEALDHCQRNRSELTDILAPGLGIAESGAQKMAYAIDTTAKNVLLRVNHRPNKFLLIGVLASLMGLLGSLTGILSTFSIMKTLSCPSQTDFCRGIEEALITPIEAILILFICIIFYFVIQKRANYYALTLSNLVDGFTGMIKRL